MRLALFSTHPFDRRFFDAAGAGHDHEIAYVETRLTPQTARLAEGAVAVCAFANDDLGAATLAALHAQGVCLVALRSAGFNHVDLAAAEALGVTVARVPAYSPYAVAEHTVGLVLTLNRKIHRAYNRVREGNFSLDGLLGFDLHGRTVGVVGTGRIGAVAARIFLGFGCSVLAADPVPDEALVAEGVRYTSLDGLLAEAVVVTLHCPLAPETRHLIGTEALASMKPGAFLINTSRGALVDTRALIAALKSGHLGAVGLDVYEEEADLFFADLSDEVIQDDVFARLLTFPNVLVTGHQAFFTEDALRAIAEITLANVTAFEQTGQVSPENEVHLARHAAPSDELRP